MNLSFLRHRWPAGAVLILLAATAVLIYSNSLTAPFTFDDGHNILDNLNIRMTGLSLGGIIDAATVQTRRPLASLTFALNYYFHGYDVTGYHVVNIAIHILAGFLMFLVVRHTLGLMNIERRDMVAGLAALVWLVNPVHTQSVTYIVQRMTALATLFFLLALYLYIKGRLRQREGRPLGILFFVLCGLSGILAVLSKQIAATLPFFILVYEWYFFQDLDRAWIQKQAKWIGAVVVVLVAVAGLYLGTSPVDKILAMYNTQDFTMGQRLLTEPRVIFLYLSLLFFPHPSRLNLDYDFSVSVSLIDPVTTLVSILGLIALLGAAAVTAKRQRLVSFGIVWFLGNLVIESSFIGLALVFEHRTYLPSVFVMAAMAWAAVTWIRPRPLAVGLLCAITLLWGFWTYQRNAIWADDVVLWQDVTEKSPNLARPWNNLGLALKNQGRTDQAIAMYNRAIEIDPGYVHPYNNLGALFLETGQPEKARSLLEKAIETDPLFMMAYSNLAIACHRLGDNEAAMAWCEKGLQISPNDLEIQNTMGVILLAQRREQEAAVLFEAVLQKDPDHTEALMNLALIADKRGDREKAVALLEKAVDLNPVSADAHYHLGELLAKAGNPDNAMVHLAQTLQLQPDHAQAHNALGNIRLQKGDTDKAIDHYRKAIAIDPGFAGVHTNLADALARTGEINSALHYLETVAASRPDDAGLLLKTGILHQQNGDLPAAATCYEKALAIDPSCTACLNRLGMIHARAGRLAKAAGCFEELALLVPGNPVIHYNLACLYARQNQVEPAVENLEKALDAGYDNLDQIRTDKDLEPIRDTEFYKTRIDSQEPVK